MLTDFKFGVGLVIKAQNDWLKLKYIAAATFSSDIFSA